MPAPFDDLRALAAAPAPVAPQAAATALETAPGRLGELALWLRAHPGADADRPDARLRRPILALYVSSSQEDGPDAAERARARMEALAAGEASACVLARAQGAGVELFDLALDRPAPAAADGPAMSERECAATAAFGMEALAKAPDLLALGDASPGSAERVARLATALLGGNGEATAARGVAAAGGDPLQLLRELGGRETAALLGALLAARAQSTPVLLDGEPALAAALVLQRLNPDALAHVRIAHRPASPAGTALCDALRAAVGADPLLDLHLVQAEGAGAVAALALVKLAGELDEEAWARSRRR